MQVGVMVIPVGWEEKGKATVKASETSDTSACPLCPDVLMLVCGFLCVCTGVCTGVQSSATNTECHPQEGHPISLHGLLVLTGLQGSPRDPLAFTSLDLLDYKRLYHIWPFHMDSKGGASVLMLVRYSLVLPTKSSQHPPIPKHSLS